MRENKKMSSHYKKVYVIAFITMALAWCLTPKWAIATVESNVINQVSWDKDSKTGECTLLISGSQPPIYTAYELFNPQRIILDIASGSFDPQLHLPFTPEDGPVSIVNGSIIPGQNNNVARLELELSNNTDYKVKQDGSNVIITFISTDSPAAQSLPETEIKSVVTDIQVDAIAPEKATVIIYSSGPVGSFSVLEEPKNEMHSARLIVDLPSVQVEDKVIPVALDSPVALVQAKQVNHSTGSKLIIDSADNDLFAYDIQSQGNYLELTITAKASGSKDDTEIVALLTGHGAEGSTDKEFLAFAEETPDLSTANFSAEEIADNPTATPDISNVNFAGYGEQKISVDFYKIDLHNVFRLIGEISNRNIVVDESVSGSLTLSMKDVPWDFLLDVVINLKDLSKEERFNTIVISPKSEGFTWPESVTTELEITVEPIIVTKRLQTGKEKTAAKKLIHQGGQLEDAGNTLAALAMYEKAFLIWPENGDLANRIAVISLANLGQNAKAAHYAKIAVQENPEDYKAALIAGMSLANMEKIQEAKEYFDLAVSGMRPSKHAIASYAAFSEQNGSYDAALSLLDQYSQVYGNTLETMISRARIYDSMGSAAQADEEYKAILLSGYELPADLKTYVTNRVNGIQ
jgi:type IV pilus assembly protein PilQ